MTPLAQRIVNELTLPMRERVFVDRFGLLKRMDDVHCFECSAVEDAAVQLGRDMVGRGGIPLDLAFLPAPKAWIEIAPKSRPGWRLGFLLVEQDSPKTGPVAGVGFVSGGPDFFGVTLPPIHIPLRGSLMEWNTVRVPDAWPPAEVGFAMQGASLIFGAIAMINTPRIIGRRTHMPHAGLQRRLAKARGMVGKFPLHAWTEIKLEVSPPKDASDQPVQDIRLTGRKALHFCRTHLRIRSGQLELVRAHWRGDPALGIKQSRYRLTPPRNRTEAA